MHVADQPAVVHVAHDALDGCKSVVHVRHVVHGQDDAGDQLDAQAEREDAAEGVPVVQVLRGREINQAVVGQTGDRKAGVEPALETGLGDVVRMSTHVCQPTLTTVSDRKA